MTPPELCRHQQEWPENAEWPDDVYWDHYSNCIDDAKRRELLLKAREWTAKGTACHLADHPHQIETLSRAFANMSHVLEAHHLYLDEQILLNLCSDRCYRKAHDQLAKLILEATA